MNQTLYVFKRIDLENYEGMGKRLPEKHFCRIHRSSIAKLNFVDSIEERFNNSYKVYLNNSSDSLVMSGRYVANLKSKMS